MLKPAPDHFGAARQVGVKLPNSTLKFGSHILPTSATQRIFHRAQNVGEFDFFPFFFQLAAFADDETGLKGVGSVDSWRQRRKELLWAAISGCCRSVCFVPKLKVNLIKTALKAFSHSAADGSSPRVSLNATLHFAASCESTQFTQSNEASLLMSKKWGEMLRDADG